jgi:DNA-binding NarL/FixJ family response regulator
VSRCWIVPNLTANERDKICRLYVQEKLSEKIIGIRFNLTEAGVRRVLCESGIPTRYRNGKTSDRARQVGGPRLKVPSSEISRLRSSGLSVRAIGRELGISQSSVRRRLTSAA